MDFRRTFTYSLFLVVACFAPDLAQAEAQQQQPNIVFLLADDHRWDCFGFMGDKMAHTPNLDQLAKKGMHFSNVHHASPICLPSRACIITGRYEGATGCFFSGWSLSREEFDLSYAGLTQKAGYNTCYIGKYHFNVREDKQRKSKFKPSLMPSYFDTWYGVEGQGKYINDGRYGTTRGEHSSKVRGDLAIRFISDSVKAKKPFVVSIGFKAPHRPWSKPRTDPRFYALYKDKEFPHYDTAGKEYFLKLPEVVQRTFRGSRFNGVGKTNAGHASVFGDAELEKLRRGELTDETWAGYTQYRDWDTYQEERRCYYALVAGVDDAVGRVVAELKRLGIDKNTIVIYSSDNGSFLGARMLEGKDLLYRESVRAPLIVYDPRAPKTARNKSNRVLSSTVDIAPTILDYAGIKTPDVMQGKSLRKHVHGDDVEVHEAVFSENSFAAFGNTSEYRKKYGNVESQAVTTQTFKYIRYHRTQPLVEELFKLDDDSQESVNLVADPKHVETLRQMRKRCDAFVEKNLAQRQKFMSQAK